MKLRPEMKELYRLPLKDVTPGLKLDARWHFLFYETTTQELVFIARCK